MSRLLHWSIALLILFLIWLGWWMVDLDYYHRWYNRALSWHKSLGMIVLALALVKIGWQRYTPIPRAAATLKPREARASRVMHGVLLAMMILLPVTGYLISTSAGAPVSVFGWFEVPALLPKIESLRDLAIEVHFWLAYGAVLLVAGHGGAALKHEFIDRDGTLQRML